MGLDDPVEDEKKVDVKVKEGNEAIMSDNTSLENTLLDKREDRSSDDIVEENKENNLRESTLNESTMTSEQPREAASTLPEAAKILADRLLFISDVTGKPSKAKEAGYITGSNIAVVKRSLERVLHGEASLQEYMSLASNVGSILEGFFHTANAFTEVEEALRESRKEYLRKMAEKKKRGGKK